MNNRNIKIFHNISIRIAKLINIILMTIPFAVCWYANYADKLWVTFAMRGHWLVIGLFAFLYFTIGKIYEAFSVSFKRPGEVIYSQLLTLLEADVIMYIVALLLIRYMPAVLPMLMVYAVQAAAAIVWTYMARTWYFHTFPASRTFVVCGSSEEISGLVDSYGLAGKFDVQDVITAEKCAADMSMLDDAGTVFIADVTGDIRNAILTRCMLNGVTTYLLPTVNDMIISGASHSILFHSPMLKAEKYDPPYEYILAKRFGDIVLSLIAIILFSPVMLVTAICIKLEDHGPVIYKQCRLTKDARKFDILKFRSMRTDAESDGVARLSTGDHDDRITRVGHVIRKLRIDEMPQLFNILRGDISIVGPRAERPELAAQYEKELPEFALRLQAKAGLTGYAQVYGKYNTTPHDKLLMDLTYIGNAGILEDIRIIFATVKILFMAESTEGIEEGHTTAMK